MGITIRSKKDFQSSLIIFLPIRGFVELEMTVINNLGLDVLYDQNKYHRSKSSTKNLVMNTNRR